MSVIAKYILYNVDIVHFRTIVYNYLLGYLNEQFFEKLTRSQEKYLYMARKSR